MHRLSAAAVEFVSYDNTIGLGADTWRHVAFIEQRKPLGLADSGVSHDGDGDFRWLMSSDVCKHCTHAVCLDVCPTGALFRTEFGTVVVQEDACNGCGYCIPACPYGVIDQREHDGRAFKCTTCYDRLGVGMEPACAQACPTDSPLISLDTCSSAALPVPRPSLPPPLSSPAAASSRAAKAGAAAGGALSVAALIHDLGQPTRFVNMLRTFKVTSPMSVGSWLLGGFVLPRPS